ncbi:uncharacterized protein TNCV_3467881 [Trichonephila clavipes]|nr:uncharacterized protein TNCV_3467881 [Trichonephila clavipes]
MGCFGRQVAGRNYPPTNKNTLSRALTEEWDKLPQQLLDNVVQSMEVETDQAIEEPTEIMHINQDSEGSFRSYYPYGFNVIWKGESVLLTFKQKSEDSLYIPNFDKSIDNSNNIGLARISRAKRGKRVTTDMTILKNSMLELAVNFDHNYNTGLIKSFMFGMNKTEIKIMTDILSRYKFRDSHGDLGIVKDDLLRNFMENGTGFRLMFTKNKSNVMKQIIKDLGKFYLKIAIKYGMPIEDFNQFRSYVATEIRELDFTVENEIMYEDLLNHQ